MSQKYTTVLVADRGKPLASIDLAKYTRLDKELRKAGRREMKTRRKMLRAVGAGPTTRPAPGDEGEAAEPESQEEESKARRSQRNSSSRTSSSRGRVSQSPVPRSAVAATTFAAWCTRRVPALQQPVGEAGRERVAGADLVQTSSRRDG